MYLGNATWLFTCDFCIWVVLHKTWNIAPKSTKQIHQNEEASDVETSQKFSGAGDGTRTREMKAWEAFALPLGHARVANKSSTVAAKTPALTRAFSQAYTRNPETAERSSASMIHTGNRKGFTMTTDKQWQEMLEEHELAYLRADLALSSPQSYSVEEKAAICDQMAASTAEVDAAMKADFDALPEFAQKRLMEMLCASGVESREFWEGILLGKVQPLGEPPVFA